MEEFTPSWSLPRRIIVAAEKSKQDFIPKYRIPKSKLPDSLIDPDSLPRRVRFHQLIWRNNYDRSR